MLDESEKTFAFSHSASTDSAGRRGAKRPSAFSRARQRYQNAPVKTQSTRRMADTLAASFDIDTGLPHLEYKASSRDHLQLRIGLV